MASPTAKKAAPTVADYKQMDTDTKEALDGQEKVRVRLYQVPKDSSDEQLPPLTVAINGYVYTLDRGVSVEVPETVAEILSEAGYI